MVDAGQPRQAVDGYAYVIWGTAGEAGDVIARHDGGETAAALFAAPSRLADRVAGFPFTVFVVELPLAAACAPVTIVARGASDRVEPQPEACTRR